MKGFLGAWASFSADLNLVIQIAMGVALLGGTLLARAKHYTAHGICQAAVLILSVPMIALVMCRRYTHEYCPNSPVISVNDTTPVPRLLAVFQTNRSLMARSLQSINPADQLKRSMQVVSLTDAFPAAETTH